MFEYESNDECGYGFNLASEGENDNMNDGNGGKEYFVKAGESIEFEVGLLFRNVNAFKDALRDYVV